VATAKCRALILIGDGLGDRPVPEFNGLTPLEWQPTPNLDELAARGECGLMDPIAVGVPAGSDTAHFAMLGYDPYRYYTGRGPLEALGVGMDVREGDLGFRCNFSTVAPDAQGRLIVSDRRAGRITEGTARLATALNNIGPIDGFEFEFRPSVAHRGALVMRNPLLRVPGDYDEDAPPLSDADPHAEAAPVLEVSATAPELRPAAVALNKWVRAGYEMLKDHPINRVRVEQGLNPANVCLPRGCGVRPELPAFAKMHGASGGLVVEVGLVRGLGEFIGMEVVEAPGTTGGYDTDHLSLARTAVATLERNQIVLCNLKAPDVAGHDGKPVEKQQTVTMLDEMAGVLLESLDLDQTVVVVTGDHSTPVSVKDHSGDPLPILIAGHGVRIDEVQAFGERPCSRGNLGRIRGANIMPIITNLLGIAHKFGA